MGFHMLDNSVLGAPVNVCLIFWLYLKIVEVVHHWTVPAHAITNEVQVCYLKGGHVIWE